MLDILDAYSIPLLQEYQGETKSGEFEILDLTRSPIPYTSKPSIFPRILPSELIRSFLDLFLFILWDFDGEAAAWVSVQEGFKDLSLNGFAEYHVKMQLLKACATIAECR